jgi:phosphoglycolate phosphatase-like HAD superfamily hydrolase
MYKNIIWDFDGTLIDSYPAIAESFLSALHDHGRTGDLLEISTLAKVSMDHCCQTLSSTYDLPAKVIDQAFRKHWQQSDYFIQHPFPGVLQVCEYICRIGGSNVIVTHGANEGIVGILRAHDMTRLFRGWLTKGDGYPRKPDSAAFEAALERFQLEPEKTLGIGDRDIDVMAAKGAGIFACQYGDKKLDVKTDLWVSDYAQLMKWLLNENGQS